MTGAAIPASPQTITQRSNAFTFPEMLVVLGVLTVLIALILPVLQRARRAANQIACMGHLRQIGQATLLYCADSDGLLPGMANSPQATYDWIYWETQGAAPFNDVTKSPIARYMDVKDEAVFICPSDPVMSHTNQAHNQLYYFSYSINAFIAGNNPLNDPTVKWNPNAIRLGQIKHATRKVLYVDEDASTVNDGTFVVDSFDVVADRHDIYRDRNDMTVRGNVAFCDGHAEFIDRAFVRNPANFMPDP